MRLQRVGVGSGSPGRGRLLAVLDADPKQAAIILGCTPPQLVRLLKLDPRALAMVIRIAKRSAIMRYDARNRPRIDSRTH
jgi:hypothetical protein